MHCLTVLIIVIVIYNVIVSRFRLVLFRSRI